jgi:hypothetical protein
MDIVTRAKNMITAPTAEWPVIASEPSNVVALYQSYIVPLAAIPPLAGLIGRGLLFGHLAFGAVLVGAIVTYVLSLVAVYVVAWIAGKLAPMFGGNDDFDRGLKLIAYGSTASWVGGVFRIIPFLGILSLIASLYSIYLLYTGVTPMMGVPANRAISYIVALVVAIIVVFVIVFTIVGGVIGASMMGAGMMM